MCNEAVLAILTQYATPLTFWLTGWAFYNFKKIYFSKSKLYKESLQVYQYQKKAHSSRKSI